MKPPPKRGRCAAAGFMPGLPIAGPGCVCVRWIGAAAPGDVGVADGAVKVFEPREPIPPLLPGRASTTGAGATPPSSRT